MTPKQARLLDFIRAEIEAKGISPSYAEMAAHIGAASKSGVHRLVHGLAAQGCIILPDGVRWRSIRLPSRQPELAEMRRLLTAVATLRESDRTALLDALTRLESAVAA